ncbi:MAG: hypothetical protein EXR76_07525 [Myxococcales bacterium]|nr:hypothetical protein [Myxococcales bacterium]
MNSSRSLGVSLLLSLTSACSAGGGAATPGTDGGPNSGGAGGQATSGGAGSQAPMGGGDGGAPMVGPLVPSPVRFALADDPATTALAHIPFPSDLYRTADGKLDLRGFPRPTTSPVRDLILTSIEAQTDGFSTTATMFIGFEGPIDERALPVDGAASLTDDSSLQLVDVGALSRHKGERVPVRWSVLVEQTKYLPASTLRVRVVEGRVLRPSTTYALFVTDAVGIAAEGFSATLGEAEPEAALARAWEIHAPLRAHLETQPALMGHVAGAAVFTTQDPVGELFRARDFLYELGPPELLTLASRGIQQRRFELFDGTYRAPRFQQGNIPYQVAGEGAFVFDAQGHPVIQGTEDLRVSIAVPNTPPPPGGWPVVMYGHGTGGDWHTFVGEKIAAVLVRNNVAVVSIDQIHHGERDNGVCPENSEGCTELLYFNFLNPPAGRDNVRQSALDFVSLLRLMRGLTITAEQSRQGIEITFDEANVMYMGHSQGGINGALFLAIEPTVKGGMLSGAGGGLDLSLELKTAPSDINALLRGALQLEAHDVLDRWHPVAAMAQTFIGPGDPLNYAPYWFVERWADHPPKSVFLTVGLLDHYTPPAQTHALCSAGQVPIVQPMEEAVEGLELLGLEPKFPVYAGNVADGQASAGLAQFPEGDHFLIFRLPSAQARYANFFKSLTVDSPPKIY